MFNRILFAVIGFGLIGVACYGNSAPHFNRIFVALLGFFGSIALLRAMDDRD